MKVIFIVRYNVYQYYVIPQQHLSVLMTVTYYHTITFQPPRSSSVYLTEKFCSNNEQEIKIMWQRLTI